MAKINLTDVANGTNAAAAINANNNVIETTSDTFLSRTGESPNAMEADLDMNSNRILNLLPGVGPTEPVTVAQLESWDGGGTSVVGVTDGNKGDITVSNSGTSWLLNTRDIAASNITSGTVATARLGSGTADSTTYLRGDQTWAPVAGGVGVLPPDDTYGDVTVTDTGTTWTIPNSTITHAKYQTLAANSILGTAGSSGPPTEISCTPTGRSIIAGSSPSAVRGTLSLGDLAVLNEVGTAEIAPQAVTHDRYQQIAANRLLGTDGTAAVPQEIECSANGRQIIATASAAATRAYLGVPAAAHTHGEGEITSVSVAAINATTGTIAMTKLAPSPSAVNFLRGDGVWTNAVGGSALLTSGSSLNANNILTGTVPNPARLGTGTPSGSNFLRGDGTWAIPPSVAGGDGFPACGGSITTGISGDPWIDTTGMPISPTLVTFGATTGGVFGDATRGSTGITVAPGVECWYEITLTVVLIRSGGTGSSAFYLYTGDDSPLDLVFLEPLTTTTALNTLYTMTEFRRISSGKTIKLVFARGTDNTYDFRANLMIKRITAD